MSQDERNYSEKRDFIRMRLETPITLEHHSATYQGVCFDLSSTGIQVQALSALALGDNVRALIASSHNELPGLDADTEVIRVQELENGHQLLGLNILKMR